MADDQVTPDIVTDEKAESKPSGKPTISVKVYAPFHVYYEGEAYSLSAVNDVGPFDILPGHHNFLCMLVPSEVSIATPDKGTKTVKIHRALLHVHQNHVAVFMDV